MVLGGQIAKNPKARCTAISERLITHRLPQYFPDDGTGFLGDIKAGSLIGECVQLFSTIHTSIWLAVNC
jgi:hypothetical protein